MTLPPAFLSYFFIHFKFTCVPDISSPWSVFKHTRTYNKTSKNICSDFLAPKVVFYHTLKYGNKSWSHLPHIHGQLLKENNDE